MEGINKGEESTEGMTRPMVMAEISRAVSETAQTLFNSEELLNGLDVGPGPLEDEGKEWLDCLKILETIVLKDDHEYLHNLNQFVSSDYTKPMYQAIVSHSIAAAFTSLTSKSLKRITSRINSDVVLWLSKIFRFYESSAYFHEDPREGLVKIAKLAMLLHYPSLGSDGYEALYSRPPVIYISASSHSGLGQAICVQLGLPSSCLSVVPCDTGFKSQVMDLLALERLVQQDVAAQKTPILVVAYAGSYPLGHVDNLPQLSELCKLHNLWLHVEGPSLAALSLLSSANIAARVGDSINLNLRSWLGIPSLPCITIYKCKDVTLLHQAGLSSVNVVSKLSSLPCWITLQTMGQEKIVQEISNRFSLAKYFHDNLSELPNIQLLGNNEVTVGDFKKLSVQDIRTRQVGTTVLFEMLPAVVTFKYVPPESTSIDLAYLDNINSWLGQILQRDIPHVTMEIVLAEQHGVCLRFCPLDTSNLNNLNSESDMKQVVDLISTQITILNATVQHKATFQQVVDKYNQLQVVNLRGWAGLGAVRYVPEKWLDSMGDLAGCDKEEVNRMNTELVAQLRATDSAFSRGDGEDSFVCVRFGMVREDTDVEDLVTLVLGTGQHIEDTSRYLQSMAEVVKKGIQTAEKDLKKENDEKIWQEGLIRHLPLVGNVYNWLSPVPKEVGIKGRSLNLSAGSDCLTSGVVESTENIYKYHMQISRSEVNTHSHVKAPPQPAVQTEIKSSPQHSRSSSATISSTSKSIL